jgi:hypothetical protein
MGKKPSHRQAPRRNWQTYALVIFDLATLVILGIFVPSVISDAEMLKDLLGFLIEIARLS